MALEYGDIESDVTNWLGLGSTFDLIDKAKAQVAESGVVHPETVFELQESALADVSQAGPPWAYFSPLVEAFIAGLVYGIELNRQ